MGHPVLILISKILLRSILHVIRFIDLTGGSGVGEGEGEDAVEDVAEARLEEDCEGEADTVTGESRRFFSLGILDIRLFQLLEFNFLFCCLWPMF